MTPRRPVCLLLAILLVVLIGPLPAGPARAQDAGSYEEDLAACKALLKRRKWAEAVEAYQAFFRTHEGDERTLAQIGAIEEDLQRALFRSAWKLPDAKALFGPGGTSFNHRSRKVRLDFPDGPGGPRWQVVKGVGAFFEVRFHGKVAIEVKSWKPKDPKRPPYLYLCWSIEEKGGYIVCPGIPPSSRVGRSGKLESGRRYLPRIIAKVVRGRHKVLLTQMPEDRYPPFTVRRETTKITIAKKHRTIASAKDHEFRGGYIGFMNFAAKDVSIRGVLDKTYYQQIASQHENTAFRKWLAEEYDRNEVLPAWTRNQVVTVAKDHDAMLPADAGPGVAKAIEGPLRKVLVERDEQALKKLALAAKRVGPDTRTYLKAVAHFSRDELAKSRAALDDLLARQPEFAPGLALRGFVHLWLRNLELARKDTEAALAMDPLVRIAHRATIGIAYYEGDLERAGALLAEVERRGLMDPTLQLLGKFVHRSRRGPLWSVRHQARSKHFDVSSDHSKKICSDLARQLEMAQWRYARHFENIAVPERRARVRVFATREGYLRYALERGSDARRSLGAYYPHLRELVLFLGIDRTELPVILRHEGFHRFLHEFIEDAPIWFNEGYAEFFGHAVEKRGGGFTPGAPNLMRLGSLSRAHRRLIPLSRLFLMKPKEFMLNAQLGYGQSWLVVDFLEKTEKRGLRGLLLRYFKALRAGKSQEEAYHEVLEPKVKAIEEGYREHLVEVLNQR